MLCSWGAKLRWLQYILPFGRITIIIQLNVVCVCLCFLNWNAKPWGKNFYFLFLWKLGVTNAKNGTLYTLENVSEMKSRLHWVSWGLHCFALGHLDHLQPAHLRYCASICWKSHLPLAWKADTKLSSDICWSLLKISLFSFLSNDIPWEFLLLFLLSDQIHIISLEKNFSSFLTPAPMVCILG